ncbi:hypothetical protein RintRC_7135 [Richelia intracellularis]|nr:hypothetical protein RintRC_7135 [Richelia intracellularis]
MFNTPADINQLVQMKGLDSYIAPIAPDNIGTFELDRNTVIILVSKKLRNYQDYAYLLDNGIESTCPRVS